MSQEASHKSSQSESRSKEFRTSIVSVLILAAFIILNIGETTKMPPEICQYYTFFTYSLIFFCIALVIWRMKKKRSNALKKHKPSAVYLRMRFETAKWFDSIVSSSKDLMSIFNRLKLKIRFVNVASIHNFIDFL